MLLLVIEVKRHLGSSQTFTWTEMAESLELKDGQLQEDIWLAAPAEVRLVVRHGGDRLVCEGEAQLTLRLICGRCLCEFTKEISCPIEEQILFASRTGSFNRDPDEGEDNRELAVLEGDTIDGTEIAANAILANLPMKPLCKEDCRGLCPICGVDLNYETCSCETQESDPRLAALAQWLEKK